MWSAEAGKVIFISDSNGSMTYHVHYTMFAIEMFEWKSCFLHQKNENMEQIVPEKMLRVKSLTFGIRNNESFSLLTHPNIS